MDIANKVIESIVAIVLKSVAQRIGVMFADQGELTRDFCESLEHHLKLVEHWSRNVQFFDLPHPKPTDTDTVMLHIHTVPRQFQAKGGDTTDETVFLGATNHHLLLGDPGSGKTTTLKRLVRRLFEDVPADGQDQCSYPILLLLKDYDTSLSLYKHLADALGLPYEDVHTTIGDRIVHTKTMIGKDSIEPVIATLLDATGALVLMDGLDEVPVGGYDRLKRELLDLAGHLRSSKIVVTCRAGGFAQTLEGFSVVQIAPLTGDQIEAIATTWLGDSTDFLAKLRALPYGDLANRPLLLAQLLCIFGYEGDLPDRPFLIYRKMLTLLLREWDQSRGIARKTAYSRFDPEGKLEFLSALAYELTYETKTQRFSERDLLRFYERDHRKFGLPEREGSQVVREIETHSGIVVAAGRFGFEFSHLSLQEYLCANYVVREPFARHLGRYAREYPEPLAVATALAAEPSTWFAALVLQYGNAEHFTTRSLESFVRRIKLENPSFRESRVLGYALLGLFFAFRDDAIALRTCKALLELTVVAQSTALALEEYWVVRSQSTSSGELFLLRQHDVLDRTIGSETKLAAPSSGYLPQDVLAQTAGIYGARVFWCEELDGPGELLQFVNGQCHYPDITDQ